MITLINKITFTLLVVAALGVGWMVGDIRVDVSPYPPPAETAYPGPVVTPIQATPTTVFVTPGPCDPLRPPCDP